MKLNLTLAKMSSPAFIGGFRTLRKSRFGRAEAWAIYRTGEQIDRELERYFTIRREIEDRFAQTDGKSKFIPKVSVPAFQQELEELGNKQIELCLDHKVNLPDDCMIEPFWLIIPITRLLLCRSIPAIYLSSGLLMVFSLLVHCISDHNVSTVGRPSSQTALNVYHISQLN